MKALWWMLPDRLCPADWACNKRHLPHMGKYRSEKERRKRKKPHILSHSFFLDNVRIWNNFSLKAYSVAPIQGITCSPNFWSYHEDSSKRNICVWETRKSRFQLLLFLGIQSDLWGLPQRRGPPCSWCTYLAAHHATIVWSTAHWQQKGLVLFPLTNKI